jgi:hypothetical protein
MVTSDHIECVWDMMNDEDPDFCQECADLGETCEYCEEKEL